jgi:hypothetical protein
MKGKARRTWLKDMKAWPLRTKESPCMHKTEYLNTSDMRDGDVDNTMYQEFWRTFRVPFELYQDIVEAAYDSGRFRDDMPGRKKKKRGATPISLTLKILATMGVMALGCHMDGVRLERVASPNMCLQSFFTSLLDGW